MSPPRPITSVRACLVALIAQIAICIAAGAQSPRSDSHPMPPMMDHEKEMNLALSGAQASITCYPTPIRCPTRRASTCLMCRT
jgi:hypothetical protein